MGELKSFLVWSCVATAVAGCDDEVVQSQWPDAAVDLAAVDDLAANPGDLALIVDLAPMPDGAPERVTICHVPSADPTHPVIVDVATTELANHLQHGDPIGVPNATVYVDAAAGAGGAGTQTRPLRRATDALALQRCRYRATGERGELRFAAGVHTISYSASALAANPGYEPGPIIVDFPVRLRGAATISLDNNGRPRPDYTLYTASNATLLVADAPLGPEDSQPSILIADTSSVTVEGFVFASGHCRVASLCPGLPTVTTRGGTAILSVRSDDVELSGNVVQPGYQSAIDLRGSTGTIRNNYASDTAICVACLTGPGRVEVITNRFDSGLGGVFVASSQSNTLFSLGTQAATFTIPQFTAPADTTFDVTVEDNVLSGHTGGAAGFGVRLAVYGRDTASTIDRQVITARVRNNRVAADNDGVGASQGLLIDSGFSDRLSSGILTGTLFADVTGNTFTVSGARVALMTARAQPLLGAAAQRAQWKTFGPLERGTLVVDTDLTYPTDFRIDHFAADPLADQTKAGTACSADADCSTATYRGAALPGRCNTGTMTCECVPGLMDSAGICTDPTPPANVVVVNGSVIPAGTTVP